MERFRLQVASELNIRLAAGEVEWQVITHSGQTADGRRLHVTFTLRHDGQRLRVISARDMHRKERAVYEAKVEEGS